MKFVSSLFLDSALATDYVPKAEAIHVLSRYLSGLTLTDEDGFALRLPEGNIPAGFHLIHKRCSKRSLYEIIPGFAIILSKENSWRSNVTTEESRVSVFRIIFKGCIKRLGEIHVHFLPVGYPRLDKIINQNYYKILESDWLSVGPI